jgi:peroxiredoxin
MKIKSILFVIFIITSQLLLAQDNYTTNYFLVKGKVTNKLQSSWSLYKTGFLDDEKINIILKNDGTFNQKIPIEGIQDLSFIDAIYIYAQPNDTIEINWDEKNFEKTIEVKSPIPSRNRDFQKNLKLWSDFRQSEKSLFLKLFDSGEKEDSVKYKWINDQFNQQLKIVVSSPGMTTEQFVYQIYFKHINLLLKNKLLKNYILILDNKTLSSNDLQVIKRYLPDSFSYKALNNKVFYLSPVYREFLFEYLRNPDKLLTSGQTTNSVITRNSSGKVIPVPYTLTMFYNGKNDVPTFTPTWDNYYTGLSQIRQIPIRDWFVTKTIFFAFNHYRFDEVESVLIDFMPKCQTKVYKDTLNTYYTYIKRFKNGNPAPNFSLKDHNGKSVSLIDFKGKSIYLNFWGVHCSASKGDIQSFYPSLMEKYKGKDLVFINICIDENEKNWKNALSENNLGGVNLLAENGADSKVCNDYNFFAPPSYILIDKRGKIFEINAPHPYERDIYTTIDKSLLDN